jgi:integrase
MPKVRLDQKTVDRLRYESKRVFIWDESLPGFGVEVAARARTYVVQYRVNDKEKRVQLGKVEDYKLPDARAKAREVLGVARSGGDPLAKVKGYKKTFRETCDEWIEAGRPDGKPRAPATIKDYRDRCTRLIYPAIGSMALTDVSPADVSKILTALGTQARNRSYVVTLIKAVFNHAVRSRYLSKAHENPADDIRTPKVKKAKRVLTATEVELFAKTLAEMQSEGSVSVFLASLLRVSLLCGLRPGEAQSLRHDKVDYVARTATVTGKTGARGIPLTEAVLAVLGTVPEVKGNPYVFAGRRRGMHIVGVHKKLAEICERAGVTGFTPYVFRHTAATQALAGGADVRAVQALLGHADLQTTAGYLHSTAARERHAAERVEAFVGNSRQ